MEHIIGEVTLQKTHILTNEVTSQIENNTQLLGLFRNLSLQTAPQFNTSSNANDPIIYISDATPDLTRLSVVFNGTETNSIVGGAAISGEYWPQYKIERANNRSIITWKRRFQPLGAGQGSRTINTIALYSPSMGAYMAALRLQTPCIQSELEILDVFYKIYIYYDADTLGNSRNNYTEAVIANSIISRWFFSSSVPLYHEGTNIPVMGSNYNNTYYDAIGLIPNDVDLRTSNATRVSENILPSYAAVSNDILNYPITQNFTNTQNISQGTTLKSLTMATTAWVGTLVNKMAIMRWDYSSADGTYYVPYSAIPVFPNLNNYVQSVYLKNAASKDLNFAYLDPSSIGSSTASLVIDSSGWTRKYKPSLLRFEITQGGDINTAKYKVSTRNAFGFASNLFSTEYGLSMNTVFRRYASRNTNPPYTNSTGNGTTFIPESAHRVSDYEIITTGKNSDSTKMGISIINVYNSDYVNFDNTTTPSLNTNGIQCTAVLPDGDILIATTDIGLCKLSADRTTITQFTSIGAGVNDNICYSVDVKFNGDIWAMFEGGLAKYTASTSTWKVHNSTSTPSFTASEFNPTWSNTLAIYCRKDSASDELALLRINDSSNRITWWSPSAPTAVPVTGANTASFVNKFLFASNRPSYYGAVVNLPGTSVWFFQNAASTTRLNFGATTGSVVVNGGTAGTYKSVLRPYLYNGEWTVRSIETTTSSTRIRCRLNNATGTILDETNLNAISGNSGYNNVIHEVMDDYFTIVFSTLNGPSLINTQLYNPLTPLSPLTWEKFGWDAGTSSWVNDGTEGKPVHTLLENLPYGIKCKFTPTGTNDFITGERWEVYLYDGFHKDNSTSAVLTMGIHARDSYVTTDLSSNTVPSTGLGVISAKSSTYTLNDDRYSWNGIVSNAGSASSTVALSMRSELIPTGDFTFTFTTPKGTQSGQTATNTTSYIGFYERDALTPTSKWSFQFRNDGYVVAEDDVAKTTRVQWNGTEVFGIKRIGNTITYLVNSTVIFTSTITSTNPLRGMIRMATNDNVRIFMNMNLNYNETRPVVRIGNPVNHTGIYDSRYAMVEAWLSSPRTTVITLNGVPAEVITDPMVQPLAGQVLLLQKSGMLVFNTADAGKTIACSSTILLET